MPADPRKHTKPQMRWEDADIPTLEAELRRVKDASEADPWGQTIESQRLLQKVRDAERVLAWAKGELYRGQPVPDEEEIDRQLADLGFSSRALCCGVCSGYERARQGLGRRAARRAVGI